MSFLKDNNEREQLRQLVKACLLEISKLKIELRKCQKESLRSETKDDVQIKAEEDNQKKIQEKEKEIAKLNKIIKSKNDEIEELEKIRGHFKLLISKPKKDLTSFQSQMYQLLPDGSETAENLYSYIQDLGFDELSYENFEYVLKNLERKGYFESSQEKKRVLWKKIEKQ
jgi:hypothetical protein